MPAKRKRLDRGADVARPSPHRPGDTQLGQHDRDVAEPSGRGGRGGRNTRRSSDRRDSTQSLGGRGGSSAASSSSQRPTSPIAQRPPSSSSQAAGPLPPATRPTPAPSQAPPSQPATMPSTYPYDILTADKVASWSQDGRQEVIRHGVQSREDVDITELSSLFQEFIHSVVEGRLNPADAGTCIEEILGPESKEVIKDAYSFEPHGLFLDTLSIVTDNDASLVQPQLRDFLIATKVSTTLMREVLDSTLLNSLGLIRDTFQKLGVRHATNLLYRQSNYNLLREETEGYSKLATELYTTSETEPPTAATAQMLFERIKGLIGTFDLDVGRVLDIFLDVFAAVVIKHTKVFIKLLRTSSWWPRTQLRLTGDPFVGGLPKWALPESAGWQLSDEELVFGENQRLERDVAFWQRLQQIGIDAYFELGGRRVVDADIDTADPDSEDDTRSKYELEWIKTTKTLPPPGNRFAAQLLGFKLRYYVSEVREDDILPANMIYLAALLIKTGFISLTHLYPHIWPLDDEMPEWRERKEAEIQEAERKNRPGVATNALMNAAPLPDDTLPVPTAATGARPRDATKPEAEQKAIVEAPVVKKIPDLTLEMKALLLVHLLTIGAIPEGLFMLGKNPWLAEVNPDVLPRVHRLLHHSIEKVYQRCRAVSSEPIACPARRLPEEQIGAPKGTVRLVSQSTKRPLKWAHPDKSDQGEQHLDYRFYWDEWADNVPVCQTIDDFFSLCNTLLNVSGVNIGKDESLHAKIASIAAQSLVEDKSQANLDRWQDLLRRVLVPALSMTHANASIVNAVWDILKLYPTAVRYAIYAEWYEGPTSRLPAMKAAFARTRIETMGTMKRISLTNLSEMAKKLAKTSYSSPGVVFKVALDQIESYANLIEAFVECAKYFTDLAYDVLVWSLMSSLGGKGRTRTQETSVLLTSKWLQALSRFSGKVFRRYANLNPTPVIQYVNQELFRGNSTDLIILKELISSMGGVVPTLDFTDEQIMAMSGGEILRRQTLVNVQDRRFDSVRSSDRLMRALVVSRLAGPLLINIAQYRQSAIHQIPEDEAHIKYLSSLVDDSHQILIQYLDLLRSNLDPAKFDGLVPSINQLMTDYGMDASLAFLIGRESLTYNMFPKPPKPDEKPTQASSTKDDEGDVPMGDIATPSGTATQSTQAAGDTGSQAAVEDRDAQEASPPIQTSLPNGRKPDNQIEVLHPIIDCVQSTKPAGLWQKISPEFYVMFWALNLGDLAVPEASYIKEHTRVLERSKEVMRDRSDMTRAGIAKKKKQNAELNAAADQLKTEMTSHMERFQKNKLYMTRRFKSWFPGSIAKVSATSDAIIEQCLLPRMLLSASDAEYTYKFVRFLHNSAAPNFQLLSLYNRFFNSHRLRSMIFTCTVREAEHLGRFLKCILRDLSTWHRDPAVYEKEGLGVKPNQKDKTLHGFATQFDDDGKPTAFLEHKPFRDVVLGWHKSLYSALRSCLAGMEWMHIRNAITVLKSVVDYFPAVIPYGEGFVKQLKTITEREAATKGGNDEEVHRVDLSVAAQTALSELQRRSSKWVIVQAFGAFGQPAQSGDIAKADTKPSSNTQLRATAPEFKPQPPARSAPSRIRGPAEVEDGEVKDPKDGRAAASSTTPISVAASADTQLPPKPVAPQSTLPAAPNRPDPRAATSSKPSTPKPIPSVPVSTSSWSEGPKSSTLPAKSAHNLPSRPDVPIPNRVSHDQFGQIRMHEGREMRDPRDPRDPRGTRERWDSREVPRELPRDPRDPKDKLLRDPSIDRRPPEAATTRMPEKDRSRPDPGGRGRADQTLPERDRGPRDRAPSATSRSQDASRPPRDPAPPTPITISSQSSPQESLGNAERAAPRQQNDWLERPDRLDRLDRSDRDRQDRPDRGDRQERSDRGDRLERHERSERSERADRSERSDRADRSSRPAEADRTDRGPRLPESDRGDIINPARAALINEGRHPEVPREDGRDRNSQRMRSPRRNERFNPEHGPTEPARDDRHGRSHHSDYRSGPRDSHGPGDFPSGSSRNERLNDRESDRTAIEKGRDGPFGGHSRLYQDDNYGRLNPAPPQDAIPSGPRGRGRGTARGGAPTTPSTRPESRLSSNDTPRAPTPERQPPTGPSSGRGRRGPYEPGGPGLNSPVTPAPPPPSNPDRMRPPSGPGGSSSLPSTPSVATSVHPDRLAQIAPPPPPPPPGPPPSHGHPRQSLPPVNIPDRAGVNSRGPPSSSGNSGAYPGPPVPELSAPTGPASGNDRLRTSDRRRQIAGINNTLQQGSSLRRAGGSRTFENSDIKVLAGGSPVSTPTQERPDPIRTPVDTGRGPSNGEDHQRGSDHERSRRDNHRDRSDRSGRPSRRNSRERERSPERERESKDPRDYRDRRSGVPTGALSNGKEERELRRSGRDASSSSRDMAAGGHGGGGRDSMGGGRELRHRDSGLPPKNDEWGHGGRGGGPRGGHRDSGGPRMDGHRDLREPRDDRGRKRRSEEGMGVQSSDREKRQRH